MNPISFSLLILISLTLLSIATAQERAPHGLAYENPQAFSPSAYDFFHPNARNPETKEKDPCTKSKCSPFPLAAQVEATQIHESKTNESEKGRKQNLGVGGIVGIVFGVAFVVLLAMAVYHVRVTRRTDMIKAKGVNNVQLDA